ncbi:MAG: hypothetical protein P8Z37_16710, partial [Acidobacteriota bacterium]
FGQALQAEGAGVAQSDIDYAAGQFRDLLTRELVRYLSKSPTILILDDYHEADEATSIVLDYLSSDIQAHPVLLCVGFRPDEGAGQALSRVVQLVLRQNRGEVLPMRALAAEGVEQMISWMTGEPALKDSLGSWMYRLVGGNPFFLEEMLKHLHEQGTLRYASGKWLFQPEKSERPEVPDSVGTVIRRRMKNLPSKSRVIATWLALINRPVSSRFIRKVAPIEFSEITAALRDLANRQMIRFRNMGQEEIAEIRHALTAEVLRSTLSGKKRRTMHVRIAEALERESGGDVHLHELARHCMEGKMGEKAVRYALALAMRAKMEFSHEVAMRSFEFVLDERTGLSREDLCRIAIDAADTMLALGFPDRAIKRLKGEIANGRKIERDLKGRMYMQLALSCQHKGDFKAQEEYCRRGLRLFRGQPLSEKNLTRAMLYAELAFSAAVRSHPRRGLDFLKKSMQACPDSGAEVLLGRIQIIATFLFRVSCELYQALTASKIAANVLSRTDSYYLICSAYSNLGFILVTGNA